MTDPSGRRIEIDGDPATVDLLWPIVGGAFGHFTAMQVRDRRARVVDRHLVRLEEGTQALFGCGLDGDRVLERIRHALGDDIREASVRVYVYGADADAVPSVMVTVREPASMPSTPRSLQTVPYQRPLAHIKHLGGFGQAYHRRLAVRAGFDEALLVGPDGVVAEGSITNIGFIEGDAVVWPDAPALHGMSMQVLERELPKAGIAWSRRSVNVAEIGSFDGAFLTNARGIAPVGRIDDTEMRLDAELVGDRHPDVRGCPVGSDLSVGGRRYHPPSGIRRPHGEDEAHAHRIGRDRLQRLRHDVGVLGGGAPLRAQRAGRGDWVVLRDPRGVEVNVSLQQVPERASEKNRLHFDLYTTDPEGEFDRLLGIGATRHPREPEPNETSSSSPIRRAISSA